MAQDSTENTGERINYGRFINQFWPEIMTLIRQLKRINTKVCRPKISALFNETYTNEEMLPKCTHTHICMYACIYIYIYI